MPPGICWANRKAFPPQGADLHAVDEAGHDALFCAAMGAHGGIGTIPCRHSAAFELLLEAGADVGRLD